MMDLYTYPTGWADFFCPASGGSRGSKLTGAGLDGWTCPFFLPPDTSLFALHLSPHSPLPLLSLFAFLAMQTVGTFFTGMDIHGAGASAVSCGLVAAGMAWSEEGCLLGWREGDLPLSPLLIHLSLSPPPGNSMPLFFLLFHLYLYI